MLKHVADLPADIICELFMHVSSSDPLRYLSRVEQHKQPGKKYALGWLYLTQVCRQWRSIGLDIAPLWAAIVSFFPSPSIADVLLARSRDSGLHLELLGHIEDWVIRHLDRASALHVGYGMTKHGQDALQSTHLPALHSLTMRRSFGRNPVVIDAPNLREVYLNETVVSFAASMCHLTTLEIIHVYYSPSDMLDMLARVPSLEDMRLHGGEWYDTFPRTIVRLQHLARFNMHASSARFFIDLWDHLSAPPTVTVHLVTNDIPEVHHLFAALRSQLVYASHDALIIYSSGFSLTCGEPDADGHYVAGVGWLFASGKDLGHAVLNVIELMRLYINVANIRHCELELSYELKELHYEGTDPLSTRLGDALYALSGALTSTTTLALQGFEPNRALLRALSPRGSCIPFPNLHNLLLGKHQSSWVDKNAMGRRSIIATDWPLIETMLAARKTAGVPVDCLVLGGEWCIRERETQAWTSQWLDHSKRCCELGLVIEVKDERILAPLCDVCNMPELETLSGDSDPELEMVPDDESESSDSEEITWSE